MSFDFIFQREVNRQGPRMARLEDLKRGAPVKGILPDCLVTVIDVKWYGSAAVEATYKDSAGKPRVVLQYWDREQIMGTGDSQRCLLVCPHTTSEVLA